MAKDKGHGNNASQHKFYLFYKRIKLWPWSRKRGCFSTLEERRITCAQNFFQISLNICPKYSSFKYFLCSFLYQTKSYASPQNLQHEQTHFLSVPIQNQQKRQVVLPSLFLPPLAGNFVCLIPEMLGQHFVAVSRYSKQVFSRLSWSREMPAAEPLPWL